jgi:GNAT superfamily N-acetyltransferase
VPEIRTDCIFEKYDSAESLPQHIVESIIADGGEQRLELDSRELSENATMWVAIVNGRVASTVFTRRSCFFKRWFLPLGQDDVVVFRLQTHSDFRGRGLAPSLIRHCLHQHMQSDGHAYIDCRTYNKPSIRCIEKCGFVRVATKKTIRREWALYDHV